MLYVSSKLEKDKTDKIEQVSIIVHSIHSDLVLDRCHNSVITPIKAVSRRVGRYSCRLQTFIVRQIPARCQMRLAELFHYVTRQFNTFIDISNTCSTCKYPPQEIFSVTVYPANFLWQPHVKLGPPNGSNKRCGNCCWGIISRMDSLLTANYVI